MMLPHKTYHVDYVVVGSGVAGVRAAIELSQAGSVLVLAKSDLSESATAYAQGGIAVALSDEDEICLHEQDTINAGDGLCRTETVALLVEEGPKYITQLIDWGTEFDRAGTKLAFTREAAHSRSRILHAHGDSTGREISRALLARAHIISNLHLRAHAFTTGLMIEKNRVVGVRFLDENDGSLHELHAGGVLRNVNLERFMKRYHEAQELAPRDVVARAITSEMHKTNSQYVYLDMTGKPGELLEKRFPRIYSTCLSYGLDLASDLAPVSPAAHFMMGGVKTDPWGRTSVGGLYAAGETAATGVHGANRLASNSLLEALVFGGRAGIAMMKDAPGSKKNAGHLPGVPAPKTWSSEGAGEKAKVKPAPSSALTHLRELMWSCAGILRSGKELKTAIDSLRAMEIPHSERNGRVDRELRNLHALALLIARSALTREESRGSHYRSDFPFHDDEKLQKHSLIAKDHDVTYEK